MTVAGKTAVIILSEIFSSISWFQRHELEVPFSAFWPPSSKGQREPLGLSSSGLGVCSLLPGQVEEALCSVPFPQLGMISPQLPIEVLRECERGFSVNSGGRNEEVTA